MVRKQQQQQQQQQQQRPVSSLSAVDVRAEVARAHEAIERTSAQISEIEAASRGRSAKYGAYVDAVEAREQSLCELRAASLKCARQYIEDLAEHDVTHAMHKTDLKLSNARFERATAELPWLTDLEKASYAARARGHSHGTKWRAVVNDRCSAAEQSLKLKHDDSGDVGLLLNLRNLRRDINLLQAAPVVDRLVELEKRSMELAARRDPAGLGRLMQEQQLALGRFQATKAVEDDRVHANIDTELQRDLAQKRDLYDATTAVLATTDVPLVRKQRRRPKLFDRPQPEVRRSQNLHEPRSQRGLQRAMMECSSSAVCEGLYLKLIKDYPDGEPSESTLRALLRAAKLSGDADVAIRALDEVEKHHRPEVRWYNAAIDVCAAVSWRKALGVFERLNKNDRVQPNTHTYSLMLSTAAGARGADAGEVYQGLIYAGVPEHLAYTAAAANALGFKPDLTPKPQTAPTLGSSKSGRGTSRLEYPSPNLTLTPLRAHHCRPGTAGSPYYHHHTKKRTASPPFSTFPLSSSNGSGSSKRVTDLYDTSPTLRR